MMLAPTHVGGYLNRYTHLTFLTVLSFCLTASPRVWAAGSWSPLVRQAPSAVELMLLMPDGTVMHAAVSAANGRSSAEIRDVIQFLADHGATLDDRDASGATPRQIANGNRMTAAATLLSDLIVKSGATPKGAR